MRPIAMVTCMFSFAAANTDFAAAATIEVPGDQPTIQAGVDAAAAGDTVLVAAGTYRERIRLKAGVTVRSVGDDGRGKLGLQRAEVTIIDGAVDGAAGPGVSMAAGSTLDGFTVTGVGEYDEALWKKHHATQGEEQPHEHIGVAGTAGVSVIGIAECTVANNIVHHIGYTGIAITGAKGKRVSPHIVGNVTYRNMGGGIGSMKESTATIEKNVCFENFYAGIGHNNASPLAIDNVCHGNIRAGIGVSEHSRPVVRGNKCYRNRRAGIGVRTGAETEPLVEGNECYENDMAGIGVRDSAAPIIRNNRCYKNAMAGVGCRTKARPLIEDNQCYENKMAGIGCRSEAEPVIRGNRCWNNKMAGIGSQQGARPVIVDNECFANAMAGIGTEEDAEAIIRGNRCYKNLLAGIGARQGARPIIADNQCYENLMAGIGSEDGADAIIRGNQCRENQQAGIGVRGGATALIVDNKCVENKLIAVGVRSGSKAHITGNLLVRTGGMPPMIAVREQSAAVVADNVIRGGGVAGVMVQGTARVSGNQFDGNGPRGGPGPPNFAVWVHGGSTVSVFDNRIDNWRHALFAVGARSVRAINNTTDNFLGAAIVVDKTQSPAHVFGNVALSSKENDKAAQVGGPRGVVAENERKSRPPKKEPEAAEGR
ncbi:MAG: right-handed parallel beta-helix repeat-containing protein [Pirellulaceae bacterium]|nr:right-handed parallel beta-helix repeat-containing protein [Pirellulaceae bacterium]